MEKQRENREILSVENVSMDFGGLRALIGVAFSLNQGEILGIIGPNGSGKTTLFNLISGVYRPTSGHIIYRDRLISGIKPHKICQMGIARTFQIVQPFNEMTVLENILVGAMYGGRKGLKEAMNVADEVIEFVGLKGKIGFLPGNMTTPERRRLELARALATKPSLILLDEIMAGLTLSEVDEEVALLRRVRDSGAALIVVEHVMRAVMNLSERVIVLHQGEKIAEGMPQHVAQNEDVIKAYLGDRYV